MLKNTRKIFKILCKCSKMYLIILIIINIIQGILTPLKLFIWKYIIDEITKILDNLDFNLFKTIIILMLIHFFCSFIGNIFLQINQYIKKMYSEKVNRYITDLIVDKTSDLDMIQFDNPKLYDELQKVNEESTLRINEFFDIIITLIKCSIELIGTAGIFVQFNFGVIIICMCTTIPMFHLSIRLLNNQFELYNNRFEKKRLIEILKSLLIKNDNIKEAKIYGVYEYVRHLIYDIYTEYLNEDRSIYRKFLGKFSIAILAESIFSYGIKIYVFVLAINKRYTIGSIMMYLSTIESFQASVGNILSTIEVLYENKLYMNSLFSILELKPLYNQKDNRNIISENFKIIEFRNVYFKYPNNDIYTLKNINLKIESKKSYSLVGLNGSGKTTLIKLLCGLYLPTKGNIYIDGIDIAYYDRNSLYKNIGVVFQDFIKYPLDVKKNIGLGNIKHINDLYEIEKAAYKSGASTFINDLTDKYDTQLQKEWTRGVDLSLGQWQKIAIARAIISGRTILVLDEPTASLDANSEYEIFKSFKKMIEGKTCILISHRFSTVKLVDEIIVIKEGEIVERGNHEELIRENGLYEKLYCMQIECYMED